MKLNKFIIIISLVILIFSLIASIKLNILQKKHKELEIINIKSADSIKSITAVIKNVNLIKDINIHNCNIKNIITNDSIKILSLFENSNVKIIYRLMDTSCSSCNNKQLEILKNINKCDKLITLCNFSNVRKSRLFMSEFHIKSMIYQLDSTQKLFSEDDNSKALLMYVDREGKILRTYLLNEEMLFLIKYIVPLEQG